MKVLKIIVGIFLVFIIVAVLALAFFIRTFDLNKYKPLIVQKISEALGRPVEIRRLDFAFSSAKGIAVAVNGVVIKDDPAFSQEPFVTVENVKLAVDIQKYLSQKEIVVTGVNVAAPVIHVVRNKAGILNVQTVGPKSSTSPSATAPASSGAPATPPATTTPSTSTPPIPPFLIQNIQIDGGSIVFVDQMVTPIMQFDINKLNFQIENFSLDRPFNFSLACSLLSAEQNIQIKGQSQILLNQLTVKLQNVHFNTDLSQLVLELVQKSFPQIKELENLRSLRGKITIDVPEVAANPFGLMQLSANGELSGGKLDYRLLPQPLEDINAQFTATRKDLDISKFSARYDTGTITAKAKIEDYLKSQKYNIVLNVDAFDIKQPIPDLGSDARFTGTLNAKSNVSGMGFDPNVMIANLTGEGAFSVAKAKLENVNLLRVVLNNLSMIPNVTEKIEQNLPDKYKEQLHRNDTLFQTVDFGFQAGNGVVDINKASLVADVVDVEAKGTLDAKQTLTLNTQVSIPQDLSESMIKSVPELQMLASDSGQIVIPMKPYSGPAAKVKIFPDLEYLGKRIIANQGAQQLQKLLNKAMGRDEEPPATEQNPQGATPSSPQNQNNPEKEIIQNILDKILH